MKKIQLLGFLCVALMALTFVTSCGDNSTAPPTIAVSATGLVDGIITADIGDEIQFTIDVTTDGGFESMTITTYQGTEQDQIYTSDELQTSFTYTAKGDDVFNPYRLDFQVEDAEGRTAMTSAVVAIELTNAEMLTTFNWLFKDQVWAADNGGDDSSTIKDCEKDNVYTFNSDGTASYHFGDDTATGDCNLDGLIVATGYTFDGGAGTISIAQDHFQPDFTFAPGASKDYRDVTFDGETWTGTTDYDFGDFGILTLDETFTAIPKAN